MKKIALCALATFLLALSAMGQSIEDFGNGASIATDGLRGRTTIKSGVSLDSVWVNGNKKVKKINLSFNGGLSDFPWTSADVEWFRNELTTLFPDSWKEYQLGEIYCDKINIKELVTSGVGNDGNPGTCIYKVSDPFKKVQPLVQKVGEPVYTRGLSGRHISLWQSHGRYFEAKGDRWEWQRAPLHRTVEDMYTQSYVIPFLIPMLENAGAYVLTPRERDTQKYESVCDNDPAFDGARGELVRTEGKYSEEGVWNDAGVGFADSKITYTLDDNPFTMGSARSAKCIRKAGEGEASATWTANLPESGKYAVYISYKSLPNSTANARYTVSHKGGKSEFIVNQKIGGGTWIYLGTFEFDKDEASVSVDNICPQGKKFVNKSVLTADAVRFGGGMGKIARGLDSHPADSYVTSGLPAFAEGAMYWMQWAGVDFDVWHKFEGDYTNDYASRGAWTQWMLESKGVPFDLSMAFHTDAGTSMDDRIIGSLSVYTLMADDSRKTVAGIDRMSGRLLADYIQTQICNDVRKDYSPEWNKRMLWDRSYSESRTTGVPGMLLELLSHQNFADMKYGLDPSFRFTVSRAIYKGMLKTLSDLYGVPYTVQPLPVHAFSATLSGNDVHLKWEPRVDESEPTAVPTSYLVQTRVDDGAFDDGILVGTCEAIMPVSAGHIYSWRIVAVNEGGKSFPSEVMSAGIPTVPFDKTVLVVNNFTRVSSPTWFDTPQYAGFDGKTDGGVAYGQEINYIGECYQFRRDVPWLDDDNPGFGGTSSEYAGKLVAGNSFDYPSVHGKAILALGYAFCSASQEAFCSGNALQNPWTIDLICGKQVTTKIGAGKLDNRFQVFPENLRNAITEATAQGSNIIVSGADIATDVWDKVFPIEVDEQYRKEGKAFCQNVLGYRWLTGHASYTGKFEPVQNDMFVFDKVAAQTEYVHDINPDRYCVENPDGILPANANAATVLRYTGNSVSAAVIFNAEGYKAASFGFPLESVEKESALENIFKSTFEYFK